MSSINHISGIAAANPYLQNQAVALAARSGQTVKDFQAIGTALKANDLASAKSALTALQKDLPASLTSGSGSVFGKNTVAGTDYQKLTSALQSGDLTGAQKAFGALETDLKVNPTGATSPESSFGSTLNTLMGGVSPGH